MENQIFLETNQNVVSLLKTFAKIGSLLIIAFGTLTLIGSKLSLSLSSHLLPNVAEMQPIVVIEFIVASLALFLRAKNNVNNNTSWEWICSLILSAVTFLLAVATTIFHFVFETAVIAKSPLDINISFILIGVALLLMFVPSGKKIMRVGQLLVFLAGLLGMFSILSYFYESISFYAILPISPMPLTSAAALSVLCLTVLCANPERGFTKILTRKSPSSMLAFNLILVALTLPAIIGFVILQGAQIRLYSPQAGMTLFVIGSVCLFSIAIWLSTSALQKLELENLIIKNELEKKNISLEVDAKSLAEKMLSLEEEKEKMSEKLSNEQSIVDLNLS